MEDLKIEKEEELFDQDYENKRKEEKNKILYIQNQINDTTKAMLGELEKNDEQIDNIEKKVDLSQDHVYKKEDNGKKNLQEAAKEAVDRRKGKYIAGFALAFGGIGSIVPGVGNVVGAALGGLIGYGLHKFDKLRYNAVKEKEELEEKEEKGKNNNNK